MHERRILYIFGKCKNDTKTQIIILEICIL
jgi:hypothetical protein